MSKQSLPPLGLASSWSAALILPHFQDGLEVKIVIFDFILIGCLFWATWLLLISDINVRKSFKFVFILISFGGFGIGVISLTLGMPVFYETWSRLGAGTMKLNGEVRLFGDLVHLTSAANCQTPVNVGSVICDPWNRQLNQNPQVVKIFNVLGLVNSNLVGIFSTLIFFVISLYLILKLKEQNFIVFAFLASPVAILAIDRGNEIITISFILVGLYFLQKSSYAAQLFGSLSLLVAVFFKFWPIILVISILFFAWSRISVLSRFILFIGPIYILFKIGEIIQIMKVTQKGSPFGVSFGLKLFLSKKLTLSQFLFLIVLTLAIFSLFLYFGNSFLKIFLSAANLTDVLPWFLALMLTYFGIWVTSDSYIYRLVILFPLVVTLSIKKVFNYEWSKFMLAIILITCVSSKLPLTLALTSAMAIYFLYVIIISLRFNHEVFEKLPRKFRPITDF